MFVAVIFRTLAWRPVKEEDVHLVGGVGVVVGAAGSSGFGGGGNTFWLKRSSAFAGVSPR